MSVVIKAENISKLYRLGQVGTGTLSHDLNRWFSRISGKEDPYAKIGTVNDRTVKSNDEYTWALQDINFEINQGDVVGIIGSNGAGKSTLLKLLSRVTAPTTGNIKVKGRIASLLEVGTGFHPELTGKENVFMNGAILGMTKQEIKRKFDDIVDFAGIARYIDTPVKRYSSGMYVRLAFAVAAYLESEILILDEVLAVGDAEFQKKCLGKMGDVANKEGRTVLFVSHNMYAVAEICNSGLMLKNGTVAFNGGIKETLDKYLKNDARSGEIVKVYNKGIVWNGIQNLLQLEDLKPNEDIQFKLSFTSKNLDLENVMIDFNLHNEANINSTHSRSKWIDNKFHVSPNKDFEVTFTLKSPKLAPGSYFLTIWIYHGDNVLLYIDNIKACYVNANNYFGTSLFLDEVQSVVVPEFTISKKDV